MQNTYQDRRERNRSANDLASLAQEALVLLQAGSTRQTTTRKVAAVAKEALTRLRTLTGDDYRQAIDGLERLVQGHAARGTAWNQVVDQMERVLQWTQNAPMASQVRRGV